MSPSACSSKKTSSGDSIRPTCTTTHVQRTVSRLRPRCLIDALRSPVITLFSRHFLRPIEMGPSFRVSLAHLGAHGLASVDADGQIEHLPAHLVRDRGRVRPPACQVNPRRGLKQIDEDRGNDMLEANGW